MTSFIEMLMCRKSVSCLDCRRWDSNPHPREGTGFCIRSVVVAVVEGLVVEAVVEGTIKIVVEGGR
jgi:hypothetical protein